MNQATGSPDLPDQQELPQKPWESWATTTRYVVVYVVRTVIAAVAWWWDQGHR
jgi:hypothetical protein